MMLPVLVQVLVLVLLLSRWRNHLKMLNRSEEPLDAAEPLEEPLDAAEPLEVLASILDWVASLRCWADCPANTARKSDSTSISSLVAAAVSAGAGESESLRPVPSLVCTQCASNGWCLPPTVCSEGKWK